MLLSIASQGWPTTFLASVKPLCVAKTLNPFSLKHIPKLSVPNSTCFSDPDKIVLILILSILLASSSVMAAKIIANLIVMGSGIFARALVQAYRQALTNAAKSGVTNEAAQNIIKASKIMAVPEARQVLGVTERTSWEEILQRYDNLFEKNAKNGSFYLQSKVHRAKECLEGVYEKKAQGITGA